jgi:hypothetical protein
MTAAFATLDGQRFTRASVVIPAVGPWSADVELPGEVAVSSRPVLTFGGLSLTGAVYRTTPFAGGRTVRIVGGAGGWRATVAAQSYSLPGAVTLSLVLGDLAAACGETAKLAADSTIGSYFLRESAPAARILTQLVGRQGWWIDPAGVTQVGAVRDASPIATPFTLAAFDGGLGSATVATETPADWMPGRTWTASTMATPQTIASVVHTIVDDKLRTDVLMVAPSDRLLGPLDSLTRELDAGRTFGGCWEYVVQATDGTTADCLPAATSILAAPFPLPTHLTGIPLRPGIPGATVKPAIGSTVLIAFANGDPTKPRIVGYDGSGAQAVTLDLTAGTVDHVATVEGYLNFVEQFMLALTAAITPPSTTWTSSVVAGAYVAALSTAAAACSASAPSSLPAALTALAGKVPGTANLGCPNLKSG